MALSETDMPDLVASEPATSCTALSELACQLQALHLINTSTASSRYVHLSVILDSKNIIVYQWHPLLDAQRKPSPIAFIPSETLVAFIANKTWSIRHSRPNCHGDHAGQQTSGTERSVSEGCRGGAGGSGAPHALEGTPSHSEIQGVKRKRGGTEPPPPPASKQGATKQPQRSLACPFYLHDRIGHRNCLSKRFKRIADLRQHLLDRAHYQVVHCPRCGTIFPGVPRDARPRRDAHIQESTCERLQEPPEYPGITEDQDRSIRDTRRGQHTDRARWYMIWDCLFPGEAHPPSPYLDDSPEIQHMVDSHSMVFANSSTLWHELPVEAWAASMNLEERRTVMSALIGAFIVLSRRLLEQDANPAEDDIGVDTSIGDPPAPFPSQAAASPAADVPQDILQHPQQPGAEENPVVQDPTHFNLGDFVNLEDLEVPEVLEGLESFDEGFEGLEHLGDLEDVVDWNHDQGV